MSSFGDSPARPESGGSNPSWYSGLEKSMKADSGSQSSSDRFGSVQRVNSFLEQRSRLLSTTIRLMEQQRQHLRTIEDDRDATYLELAAVVERVQETGRAAAAATAGDIKPGDSTMESLFEENGKALDDLENVSIALRANYLAWRSAWEHFASTRENGRVIRAEMAEPPEY